MEAGALPALSHRWLPMADGDEESIQLFAGAPLVNIAHFLKIG
jgi:hypothetical protein